MRIDERFDQLLNENISTSLISDKYTVDVLNRYNDIVFFVNIINELVYIYVNRYEIWDIIKEEFGLTEIGMIEFTFEYFERYNFVSNHTSRTTLTTR